MGILDAVVVAVTVVLLAVPAEAEVLQVEGQEAEEQVVEVVAGAMVPVMQVLIMCLFLTMYVRIGQTKRESSSE